MRRALKCLGIAAAALSSCTLLHPLDRYQAGGEIEDAASPETGNESAPVDAGPSWRLYSYGLLEDAWSDPVRLADIWTGPNAPPPRNISAAVELADEARLLVFTDDGTFYLQADGVWRPPRRTAEAFAPMTTVPLSAWHVPYVFAKTLPTSAPNEEGVTLVDNPFYFAFRYLPNDEIILSSTGRIPDSDGGAKQDGRKIVWDFEIVDPTNADLAKRYRVVALYDDGIIYDLDAAGVFTTYPIAESPMWKDKANAPPTTGLTAAYSTYATHSVSFIGP